VIGGDEQCGERSRRGSGESTKQIERQLGVELAINRPALRQIGLENVAAPDVLFHRLDRQSVRIRRKRGAREASLRGEGGQVTTELTYPILARYAFWRDALEFLRESFQAPFGSKPPALALERHAAGK
jgi:hypothetical protein